MHSLEEKNHLSNELERTKKRLEDSIQAKARAEQKLADLVKNRNGHSIGYVYFYPLFPTRLTNFFSLFFPPFLPRLGGDAERASEVEARGRKCAEADAPTRDPF
jgi:hypothetical protein